MQVSQKFSVLESHVNHLVQNHSQLNKETQNQLSGLEIVLNRSLSAIVNETEIKLNQTLSAVLNETKILILSYLEKYGYYPATSCAAILQFDPSSLSGHYWIRSSNGSAVRVYCDMTRSCGNITGGWMKAAELDMRESSSQCPSALRMGTACNPIRTCVINSDNANCSSVFFTTHGFNYSKVCGMIRAYQVKSLDAFGIFGIRMSPLTLDSNYVDGISLTHGAPKRHIWTFAAGGNCKIYISNYYIVQNFHGIKKIF